MARKPIMKRLTPITALAILATLLWSCKSDESVVCTTEFRPGVVVEIRDAVSNKPAAEGAFAIAENGDFVDTLRVVSFQGGEPLEMAGAYERAGVYKVTVRKPGYRQWAASGVRVEPTVCHVTTAELFARLEPIQ